MIYRHVCCYFPFVTHVSPHIQLRSPLRFTFTHLRLVVARLHCGSHARYRLLRDAFTFTVALRSYTVAFTLPVYSRSGLRCYVYVVGCDVYVAVGRLRYSYVTTLPWTPRLRLFVPVTRHVVVAVGYVYIRLVGFTLHGYRFIALHCTVTLFTLRCYALFGLLILTHGFVTLDLDYALHLLFPLLRYPGYVLPHHVRGCVCCTLVTPRHCCSWCRLHVYVVAGCSFPFAGYVYLAFTVAFGYSLIVHTTHLPPTRCPVTFCYVGLQRLFLRSRFLFGYVRVRSPCRCYPVVVVALLPTRCVHLPVVPTFTVTAVVYVASRLRLLHVYSCYRLLPVTFGSLYG